MQTSSKAGLSGDSEVVANLAPGKRNRVLLKFVPVALAGLWGSQRLTINS